MDDPSTHLHFLPDAKRETAGIGVMSGTSLDGIDLVHCRFRESADSAWSHDITRAETRDYTEEWRERLANAHTLDAERYARLDAEYGHLLGEAIREFAQTCPGAPAFAACHGHTIFHRPEWGFTAQIGDGETISSHIGFPLVCSFRNKDIALGGQGAPLVPFGEKHLFPACRLFLNLGGFSNLTADDIAFDVSPCNFALNWAARRADPDLACDRDGRLAREGKCNHALVEKLNALDYYHRPAPKSLGREWFETEFQPPLEEASIPPADLLRTLCRHIAVQIRRAVEQQNVRDTGILITGGGARNVFLIECIGAELALLGVSARPASQELIDYKEALIFAFLGLQTLLGRPNILTSVTGARSAAVAGSIHLPR